MIKQAVQELLQQAPFAIDANLLEFPQDRSMGDLALPCFTMAKEAKKAPAQIATELAEQLRPNEKIWKIVATGPYVNFFVSTQRVAHSILPRIEEETLTYGHGEKKNELVLVESPGPNTNKPLHLGHVRNMLLGNALANILWFAGFEVKKVDIINDRGVHICKSMLAYEMFGNGAQPDKKPDHYVGDRYVRFATEAEKDPSLEEKVQVMLQQREAGDKNVMALWKTMRDRALKWMQETYERFWTRIDKAYYESDHYTKWKNLVEKKFEEWLFTKDAKGNIVYNFGEDSFGSKVLLRWDGTAIYITQDLALAQLRYDDYKMDRMVYVVGNEQEHHFQVLFALLKLLGLPFADKCYHLSYGMVSLPDGKMKSREGNVVDADNLASEMHDKAWLILKERYPDLTDKEVSDRAEQIAMAAIKFFILKYDAKKDFIFDREQSLRFDGESGPYVQYTHARVCSILEKAWTSRIPDSFGKLDQEEDRILLVQLARFGEIVELAAESYEPAIVTRYLQDLAQLFNGYYSKYPILGDDDALSIARIALVTGIKQVLENGLKLLWIEAPQKM